MFYGNVSLSEGTPHLETLPKQTEGLGLEHHFHQPLFLAGCTFNQYHQNSCDLRYLFTFCLLLDFDLSSRFFYPSPHPKA